MKGIYKTAIKAGIEAGKEIMNIYETEDFQVESKNDDSPLTIADKRANNIINKYLVPTGIPIISEENKQLDFLERKAWNKCWIVDPLDGTKEFIKRNGEFTVNIALVENQKTIFGVIYVPANRELFYGDVLEGKSFKGVLQEDNNFSENFMKEIKPSNGSDKIKVVGSRSHMSQETLDYIEKLKNKYNKEVEIVSKGSSLKFCLVAEGKADVYPRFAPTMEWDTAAGQAICNAVGLNVIDKSTSEELKYNQENLLNNYFLVSNLG
ncbi:3'(2'),5'-bisphosphate nucleotidase CysQ [Salegentibacter salegens]|uniref:3'(2'),5'-bisphosphate nucleotidase CysQ n=1 Tax=Salegentibacter salegens TaxID=143223 RepID=A0A1M7HBV2_9FLAO|nr:3'(2'),5'-bisphosphate nucleotidase CysQ [Salegentibacter salegens]PRX43517.1 3'(2'), 5'-bisphosphate nucleotidase [Salegentibacter salegens]SHM25929.1 3'(2'),5'-bisphosphate nucleotidase [Salegentibacter salegens]